MEIQEVIRKITNNFETGFHFSTLMGWDQKYDSEGRPLRADPNYRDGRVIIEDKTYYFTRKLWKVRIWDIPASYMNFMHNDEGFIVEIDLTPDYIKQREIL